MNKFLKKILATALSLAIILPIWFGDVAVVRAANYEHVYHRGEQDTVYNEKTPSIWRDSNFMKGCRYTYPSLDLPEDEYATWEFSPEISGVYNMETNWIVGPVQSDEVYYQVTDKNGANGPILIDQRKNNDGNDAPENSESGYKSIGSYEFDSGKTYQVKIYGKTGPLEHIFAGKIKIDHSNVAPQLSILLNPVSQYVSTTTPKIEWKVATDIDDPLSRISYQLLVDDDSDFSSPEVTKTNLSDNFYQLDNLVRDSKYYFSIRAYDGISWSEELKSSFLVDLDSPKVSTDPVDGNHKQPQLVRLISDDVNLESIRYTTDGTTIPSLTAGFIYVDPFVVSADTTINAIAYDKAGNNSGVQTFQYNIAPAISGENSSEIGQNSITINWTTNQLATSRVVYDTVAHSDSDISAYTDGSNYGYAFSTTEDSNKTFNHSVTVSGLVAGTTYFFRTISHGSPENISKEFSAKTSSPVVVYTVATKNTTSYAATASDTPVTSDNSPKVATPSTVEQGEIKGSEDTDEEAEKINWTPWIILFILIILAGAATGGYFYWFGKDEEEEIISKEVIEKAEKKSDKKVAATVTKKTPVKSAKKKQNRW